MSSALNSELKASGDRVVVAVTLGTDRGDGVGLGEPFGVAQRTVLDSAVAVMDQGAGVLPRPPARPQPHVERVQGQGGVHRGRHLPAHDVTREHVQDERRVDPALEGPDVGDVSDPQPVRRVGGKLPSVQVGRSRRLGARTDRGPTCLDPCDPLQALGAHEPLDRASGDLGPGTIQRGVDLADPADPVAGLVNRPDLASQPHIAHRPG